MEARRERVSSFAEKDKENNACERNQHILCNNTDHGNILVVLPLMETKPSTSIEYLENREKINDDSSTHSVTNKNFDNDDDKENTEKRRILSGSKIVNNNLEQDKIFSQTWTPVGRSPTCKSTDIKTLLRIDGGELPNTETARAKRKIPRPANAFMLFANEWRRKLAAQNPRESNKDISVRLGIFWKNMSKERKEKYFALAREVDKEHKRKYPDYVYNPKEARLRKAMREQTRELARRSILQSAIANTNARTIGGASAVSASVVGSFLNQQQPHRFDCTSVPPMGPNVSPHHATDPWFQTAHRLKSVHSSPRIGDWYGGMCGDHPIEKLRAMGAMHHHQQQQQQQQHDLEKPIKDHPALYSNGYSSAEREIRRQESAEYSDFIDGGQKWHPYQSSASPHPRAPHMSSQMGGILHPSVQNTNAHGHDPWGQFCHGMLPHVPTVARNSMMIRGPRHAVFLRDRTPTRHCAFSEDASQMGYVASKLNVDGIRASYPPEHQMPRLLSESSVDSVIDTTTTTITTTTTTTTTTTMNRREEDDGTRWEPNHVTAGMPLDELVPTSSEGTISREKERESRHSIERFERLRKKPVSKQPLPGFHQAFGSTEIGRFSRSEFFVNMVGESGDGGDANDASDGGDRSDVTGDVSRERPLLETTEAPVAAATAANVATPAPAAAATANGVFDAEDNKATFATGDNAVGVRRYATLMVDPPSSISISYCGPPTTPSWHSPHLIPEAYLTNSLMFPFPLDPHSILESNAVHGIARDGRLISPRVLPNQCCWFTQFGHAITRIPDGLVTCAALLDCSNHSSDKEWVRQSAIACPIEFLTLLGNRNASCEGTISDRANPIVVVNGTIRGREISREHGNEVRKRTRHDRKSDSNLQEFNDKKN